MTNKEPSNTYEAKEFWIYFAQHKGGHLMTAGTSGVNDDETVIEFYLDKSEQRWYAPKDFLITAVQIFIPIESILES